MPISNAALQKRNAEKAREWDPHDDHSLIFVAGHTLALPDFVALAAAVPLDPPSSGTLWALKPLFVADTAYPHESLRYQLSGHKNVRIYIQNDNYVEDPEGNRVHVPAWISGLQDPGDPLEQRLFVCRAYIASWNKGVRQVARLEAEELNKQAAFLRVRLVAAGEGDAPSHVVSEDEAAALVADLARLKLLEAAAAFGAAPRLPRSLYRRVQESNSKAYRSRAIVERLAYFLHHLGPWREWKCLSPLTEPAFYGFALNATRYHEAVVRTALEGDPVTEDLFRVTKATMPDKSRGHLGGLYAEVLDALTAFGASLEAEVQADPLKRMALWAWRRPATDLNRFDPRYLVDPAFVPWRE